MRFIRHTLRIFALFSWAILPFSNSWAQDNNFGIVEKSGNTLPADVLLLNEDSVWVKFGDLINKPTLLAFVYYRCPGLCSPLMEGIAEIIDKSDLKLGKNYQVITISVDYKEPISLAKQKKKSYLKIMRSSAASRFWQFYVTDSTAVKTLTDAAGWEFKRNGNDFMHSAATILITPTRMISQYFYGTFILPMHFHMAVDDARNELVGASRLKDQKYCYSFIPKKNNYFGMVVSSAGIGILAVAAFLFIWLSLTGGSKNISRHPEDHDPLQI